MAASYGTHVGLVVGVANGLIHVVSGNSNSRVSDNGWFNPATSTVSGYSIVGYTSPVIPSLAAAPKAAAMLGASLAQINSQDAGR